MNEESRHCITNKGKTTKNGWENLMTLSLSFISPERA